MYVMRTENIHIGTVYMYKGVSLMYMKTYGEWVPLWEKMNSSWEEIWNKGGNIAVYDDQYVHKIQDMEI